MTLPQIEIDRLVELLAKATPELTDGTVKPKTLGDLLRLGAAAQRPRADNWDMIDWQTDAELFVAMLRLTPTLLSDLSSYKEALERMRAALEPFAKDADNFRWPVWEPDDRRINNLGTLTVGDLRRARQALTDTGPTS